MKHTLIIIGLFIIIASAGVIAQEQTVCCEKTTNNLYCQQVPTSQCASDSRQAPTSCESTSFCKPGVCYSPVEGTCLENTPQITCNTGNATWSATYPAQCELGCCVLGDQAAFVSLVRCKRLSSFLGLQVNYDKRITNEATCLISVQNQDRGACVYESEFENSCKFTTRAECNVGVNITTGGKFYKDKLCTAPELGTICERTRKTACIPGKQEIYFVDTCGNPANVYDSSKLEDASYWTNIVTPENSCNPLSANSNSRSCGNCNYLQGSICRLSEQGAKANYGDYSCVDLNCKTTENGKAYKHGESWCVYKDKGEVGKGKNAVGSRFYRHICLNGEEITEQCADFRQEECIESNIETTSGLFSQAGCRVNRWQDCTQQKDKDDCENNDRRDCIWRADIKSAGSSGSCIIKNPPGLKFWEGEEAQKICAQGDAKCTVKFEKGVFGGEECVENCDCLAGGWEKQRIDFCNALGDCGPNTNWVGSSGFKSGYVLTK